RWLEWPVGGWSTTPGKFRVARAALVLAVLVSGAAGGYAANVHTEAAREIAVRAGPLSAVATELYRSLADADATAMSGFLSAGVAPTVFRDEYDEDIAQAAAGLASAATQNGEQGVTANRIADIGAQLPVYTGLVEQARANNRQGLPVGVAYLRAASELMRSTVLPEAEALQRSEAQRLDDEYERAGSMPVVALLLCAASLAGLIWAQVFLYRRTRRVFNVGLVVSTMAVVGTLLWWTVAGTIYYGYLEGSRRHSQSVTDALGPAQIAALQARAGESLTLVASDGGSAGEQDFSARVQRLARNDGAGGALGAARRLASDDRGRVLVEAAIVEARAYVGAHEQVRRLDERGRYAEAVASAVGAETMSAAAFRRLDAALAAAVEHERAEFTGDIGRAGGWLAGTVVGTVLLALAAALGVVWGIGQRLKEYP
ncbi:MAG: hypothetical protein ACRDT0_23480, partial [Pseudonocardiaceae bacterium]